MNQDEFNKVEAPAIEQLVSLGWRYIQGKAHRKAPCGAFLTD